MDFSADGYESEQDELDHLRAMLEDMDSSAVTVIVTSIEAV